MAGFQAKPGCAGRVVEGVRLLTKGVATPRELTGERAGDHNGQRKLYGGNAVHVWATANLFPIRPKTTKSMLINITVLKTLFNDI